MTIKLPDGMWALMCSMDTARADWEALEHDARAQADAGRRMADLWPQIRRCVMADDELPAHLAGPSSRPVEIRYVRPGDFICNYRSTDNPREVIACEPDPDPARFGNMLVLWEGQTFTAPLPG